MLFIFCVCILYYTGIMVFISEIYRKIGRFKNGLGIGGENETQRTTCSVRSPCEQKSR